MTTIVWDGKYLCADRYIITDTGISFKTSPKIAKRYSNGLLVGAAGDAVICKQWLRWITNPISDISEPFPLLTKKSDFSGIMISKDGGMFHVDFEGMFEIDEPFFAIGSGRKFALGAMAAGATAVEAIRITSRFDINTGGAIDRIGLEESIPTEFSIEDKTNT